MVVVFLPLSTLLFLVSPSADHSNTLRSPHQFWKVHEMIFVNRGVGRFRDLPRDRMWRKKKEKAWWPRDQLATRQATGVKDILWANKGMLREKTFTSGTDIRKQVSRNLRDVGPVCCQAAQVFLFWDGKVFPWLWVDMETITFSLQPSSFLLPTFPPY